MDRSITFEPDPGAIRRPCRPVRFSLARRSAIRAIVAAVIVLGVGAPAAAAGINGLTSGGLGADTASIGSCDSDGIRTDFQTGSNTTGRPTITGVVVSGVHPGCTGSVLHVTISGTGGAPLATGTARVTGSVLTITVPTPIDATMVAGIALVVTG